MLGWFEKKPGFDSSVLKFIDLEDDLQSNLQGLYVIGDLTGMPLIKTALNQGVEIIDRIKPSLTGQRPPGEKSHDLVIVGAGVAGLSAALRAKESGIDYVVLEQGKIANTVANFPRGKRMLCEPASLEVKSSLWAPPESSKEELVERWRQQIEEADLNIETGVSVTGIAKNGHFTISTNAGDVHTNKIVLAVGKQGNPRKLNVPGEDLDKVANKLYDPNKYHDQNILVVGGGDAAAETSLALCEHNHVIHAMRAPALTRPKAKNVADLQRRIDAGTLTMYYETTVKEISPDSVTLTTRDGEVSFDNDYVFTMIGADPPFAFLRRIGLHTAGEWNALKIVNLAAFFLLVATLYSAKTSWGERIGLDSHGWPILETMAGLLLLGFLLRPPFVHSANRTLAKAAANDFWIGASFTSVLLLAAAGLRMLGAAYGWQTVKTLPWFGVLYTALVLGFGLEILVRPRDRHLRGRKYIVTRTLLCMFSQTVFLFLLPMVLNWRAYRLITAWPLSRTAIEPSAVSNSFYFWWALGLAFVGIPLFTYFHGKRFCTMVCGCGAMAETFGDRWRDKAPKGLLNRRREGSIYIILGWAVLVTALLWLRKAGILGSAPVYASKFDQGLQATYDVLVGFAFAGLIGVGFYPFFGNRIWCRYGCPLAAMMNLVGKVKTRLSISSNANCVDCGQCNRYCQMGIDIKSFAIQQKSFSLKETPCVGCGECIAVCPMEVLRFGPQPPKSSTTQDWVEFIEGEPSPGEEVKVA